MGEPNKKHKFRIGRKQFIIAIVSVCLVALIAEAVLLIHTFLKKKKDNNEDTQDPKNYVKQTVRRVTKATMLINEKESGTVEFAYDEYGRIARAELRDPGEIVVVYDYSYFQGDCRMMVMHYGDMKDRAFFSCDKPCIYMKWLKIVDYAVDESARVTKMELDYYGNNAVCKFDSKGRLVQFCLYPEDSPAVEEEYRYDDSGRLSQIVRDNYSFADIIYEENGNTIINYWNQGAEVHQTQTYSGKDLIYEKVNSDPFESYARREYYPKDRDLLPLVDDFLKALWHLDYQEKYLPGFEEFTSLDGKERYELEKVEFTEDGQPLQNFYTDGTLRARYIYDENGRVSGHREIVKESHGEGETTYEGGADFTYDGKGNLVAIAEVNKPYSYQFEWIEMEALVES